MNGVLLVNLGSPASTDTGDVRRYLDEFLMDEYVMDVPFALRALLVRGIILRRRPQRSAAAYARIWWDEGSPLRVLSERLTAKVRTETPVPVVLAMRYGQPSLEEGLRALALQGVTNTLVLPLYPQHAMASTVTVTAATDAIRRAHFPAMRLTHFPAFYHRSDYIATLSASIARHLAGVRWDHLVFSYHGVPERHIRKTDVTRSHCRIDASCCTAPSPAHAFCYRHQCFETTRRVVEQLGIPTDRYSQSFQSRLAGDRWLQPYTDHVIDGLPARGVDAVAVVTPAFTVDCLETLEEIGMEADAQFRHRGGRSFTAIPCLNDDDAWAAVLGGWINEWNESDQSCPTARDAAVR